MAVKQWARVKRSGAHGLRRGAWYPVLSTRPTLVVLDVAKRAVPMDRSLLDFRDGAPQMWSVVENDASTSAARRVSEAALGPTYGVCPACRSRQDLTQGQDRVTCPDCGGDFAVNWDEFC